MANLYVSYFIGIFEGDLEGIGYGMGAALILLAESWTAPCEVFSKTALAENRGIYRLKEAGE